MLQKYLESQNLATLKLLKKFSSMMSVLIGTGFVVLLVLAASVPSYVFILIGISVIFGFITHFREDRLTSDLNFKINRVKFTIVSAINIMAMLGSLCVINYHINAGELFYYLFGISFVLITIKFWYTKKFLDEIKALVKKAKDANKKFKDGSIPDKAKLTLEMYENSTSLNKVNMKMSLLFGLAMLFHIAIVYWFYIKSLIVIVPGGEIIGILIVLFIAQNILEFNSNKIKKLIIGKNFDEDGE